ncbi:hypothetical protein [Neobacillus bataviensis]|uniref:hypothetical protein n=1 Tax=Neobacillus bataviensis TaxID=220685 RepID=UPI0021BDE942|nr:hypothetical protein [Neobacillus bataviensis]
MFLRALQLFEEIIEKRMEQQIKPINSVNLATRRLFEMVVFSDEEKPPGCLIVNTAVELTYMTKKLLTGLVKALERPNHLYTNYYCRGK